MDIIHSLAFAIELFLMIGFPIILGIIFRRRLHTSWKMFFIGMGFYLLNLVIQLPINIFLWPSLFGNQPWLLLGGTTLTYAICEECMRYLSFRTGKTMRRHRDENGALMAGAGHGGIESIYFAVSLGLSMMTALLAPAIYKANGGDLANALNGPLIDYFGQGLTRILAITCHMGLAVMIVLAYRRNFWFFPLAILAHFVLDFTTFGIQQLTQSDLPMYGVFTLWAALALAFILSVRRRHLLDVTQDEPSDPVAAQFAPASQA